MAAGHHLRTAAIGIAIALAIGSGGCDRGPTIEPPEPTAVEDVDSLPSLPASEIEAPLSYDLTPVVELLEKSVPKHFGDIDKRIVNPGNKRMHFAFAADREPFALRIDGDMARMTAIINYGGRVWYNPPLAPEMSASCGIDGPKPRARIEIVTPIRLSPNWKLSSHTEVRTVEAFSKTERDQCEVTFLKFDVTGKVVDAARGILEKQTRVIDQKVASIDLRSKFEEFWSVIQQPIHLSDSVWLVIDPQDIHVHQPKGQRRTLSASVGMTAAPRIVVGKKPDIPVRELPRQTGVDDGTNAFHILLEGVLAYDLASKLLTEELRGQKVSAGGRNIRVRNVRMFGLGGGKIGLQVDFAGAAKGRVFFVGTPHYSLTDDRLYVPDLEYDVATQNMLVRGMSWLKHEDLRDYLREKARWPVGGLIKQAHKSLIDGLNRDLSPGVHLSGDAHDIEIIGVHAARDAVRVRAHADGKVRLDVRQTKAR